MVALVCSVERFLVFFTCIILTWPFSYPECDVRPFPMALTEGITLLAKYRHLFIHVRPCSKEYLLVMVQSVLLCDLLGGQLLYVCPSPTVGTSL